MAVVSKRERFFQFNGLVCLAQALEGKYTTIDLRNETSVTGKIEQVDAFMNIVMSNSVFIDARGSEYPFESFFIQTRNVRYIHIPDKMPIVPTIKQQLNKMKRRPTKSQPDLTSTRKGKLLQKRQAETLRLVEEMKEKKRLEKEKGPVSSNSESSD